MADEKLLAQAKAVFGTLRGALEGNDWKYRMDEENLTLECGATGEDLPIEFRVCVDADRRMVMVLSQLPYVIPEDKRLDVAVAVTAANYRLVDGSFDYDVATGRLYFRMTNSYIDSTLGAEVFLYMLYCAAATIDEYNDRYLMLSKGLLTVQQFLELMAK